MNYSNYKVEGLKESSIISNTQIRELNKESRLSWVGGHSLIADDSRAYFYKENEHGKALFMHITGNRKSTYFVAKFN